MRLPFKKQINRDGAEAIFGGFEVANLEQATAMAGRAAAIIASHREDKFSHMAVSQDGLMIMLHGVSKEHIEDADWVIAREIEKTLDFEAKE